jgi:hypothetical protein
MMRMAGHRKKKKELDEDDRGNALEQLAAIAVEPNFANLHEAFRVATDTGDMSMLVAWLGNSHDPHYYGKPKRRKKPCQERTPRTKRGSRTPRRSTKSA